ncbi:molybdopterin-dependent oxidoreductase [Alicyclobacillus cycloheptanicus]|uniref:Anaerobic selenocysteine-containing dehydrogenase n=1 Tax=Alicyclobacillus cycloheptanicus TaxID=1457 RepID=A0ABT9XL44_9BACL|nr:molybdopterin-dependent oxidoreductase [Alicyclobacillus cycloheptanicus]MDQ0190937.1 anaerobic selenocysteine-containing dehydrogenase [Alicyclobacillus cycloheptanicus]WDM02386.1 molybdopterin-dependent oxidoreductase [Alicyclobacillus cycloheptanicus]
MVRHVKTACPLDCWDTCSILAEVEDGRVVRLMGDPSHPITQGTICSRGRRLKDRLYAEDRIVHPLKRNQHGWERISWDQALDEIAHRMRETVASYGHHAILHAYDWGSGTVLKNLNQRFFYQLGGCTETVGSLCWDAGLEAQRYDFGEARSHSPEDLSNARAIVVWGRNLAVTNMHMVPYVKRAQAAGAKLIVVNPLPTDLDGRADLRIQPRPGTDGALALGVLKICRDHDWLDHRFLHSHSHGWPAFAAFLDTLDLTDVSRETDVSTADMTALAEIYGLQGPVSTLLGIGLQRHAGGGNAIRAIDALAAATGQIGVPGGGVNYANRAIKAYFDQQALSGRAGANVRAFFRGTQADEIISSDPPIQVMVVTRTNPVTQVPDTRRLVEAYQRIPCKVVIDQFMTPTAELADYFLPCTNVLEDEDFMFSTMWHGYVTYIEQAVQPRGEALPEWEIFARLADRLGFGDAMRRPLEEWLSAAMRPLEKHGISLETFREQGTIRLPLDDVPWADGKFLTPSGKFEFVSDVARQEGQKAHAEYIPPHEPFTSDASVDALHPLTLLTVHPRTSENSQHRDMPNVPEIPVVEISDELAKLRGLENGALAKLWNDQAEIMVKVRVVAGGHPWTVKMESGWWGQGVTTNHFTKTYQADFGRQTAQYDCTCEIAPTTR